MTSNTLLFFAIAGGIACAVVGAIVGRAIAERGLVWRVKDAIGLALIAAFIAVLFILF